MSMPAKQRKKNTHKKNFDIKTKTQRLEYLNARMEYRCHKIDNKEYLKDQKLNKLLHERGDWRAYCV